MIPELRFREAQNFRVWQCANTDCKFENKMTLALSCKSCNHPRPPSTIPKDIVFPLYEALDPSLELNKQVMIFERLLTTVPLIDDTKVLDKYMRKIKMKERMKMQDDDDDITTPTPDVDFDKLRIIDDYLNMR